jgi:hypothetical protein
MNNSRPIAFLMALAADCLTLAHLVCTLAVSL